MIGRVAHRVVRRLLRGIFGVRPLLLLLLVAAVIGGALMLLPGVKGPDLGASLPGPRRAPDATENYLKGNQTFNAELMWGSLSDDALQRYQARGMTIQDMQRTLDRAKELGSRLEQINYVGGQNLPDGTSFQFYVVGTRGPTSRADVEYVTYIFTLDRAGKIAKVQ